MKKYADVIVDIYRLKTGGSFQYEIPRKLYDKVKIGTPVVVPFGNNRTLKGFVVGISAEPKIPEDKIKQIIEVPEKALPIEGKLIELAGWMRNRYGGSMNAALKTVIPVKQSVGRKKRINPYADIKKRDEGISLNNRQKSCVETFREDYENGIRKVYLLFGVTGSGKTEVYLNMIEEVLRSGRSVIVLIPEISLTYQTLSRFFSRFGGIVSVMHSKLSAGEKYEQFERAKRGDIKIMIGPRSALFAPFKDLGLIVIDEEHDGAYKSETVPRYHAAEVARERARQENASVVMGSATPSLDSFDRAKRGEYKLLVMDKRATKRPLPSCKIINMREELMSGNRSVFSRELYTKINTALSKGQQVMLFLNRRGLSGFVSCRACSLVIKCPHCDVSLSLHRGGRLKCHYCGYEREAPKVCPSCGSKYIGAFKAGTQHVENLVKKTFPQAKVLRMDADTTRKKGGHEEILKAFGERKADILIGTQMIVKGHDFPGVSLVGILAADMSLNSSDFRGAENTFALIVQAAGRAGRGDQPGEVVIQTYDPENYAIKTAATQDYQSFFSQEMNYRRIMRYPPADHLLRVQIQEKSFDKLKTISEDVAEIIREYDDSANVIGPSEAGVPKIKDTYRMAIYVKHESMDSLIDIKNRLEAESQFIGAVSFDPDPIHSF